MVAVRSFVAVSLLLSCLAAICRGGVLFSSLQRTLLVDSTHTQDEVFKAGNDQITISWSLNRSAGSDSSYRSVKVKLCFATISQKDRAWRKTVDDLSKDKTCTFKIVDRPYTPTSNNSFTWTIERDVPTAMYFIRVYAFNAEGHEVAYGDTTNQAKTANLFQIQAITGRHLSLDIASVCFSAFSILSLAFFFYIEKRKARIASK